MSAIPASDIVSPLVLRDADPQQNNGRREVAFIDKGVADYQTLVDGVRAGVEVVLLDSGQDGLAQMAAWAQGKSGYDAIHVLSHGAEGQVWLGTATLDDAALAVRAQELATLGAALTEAGDLLLYGCNVAAGQAGAEFVGRIAQIVGADIAASTDLTGSAQFGGNWGLEAFTPDPVTTASAEPGIDRYGALYSSRSGFRVFVRPMIE